LHGGDRLYKTENKLLLKINDRVLFKNCGAYTSSWNSGFILEKPKVYILDNFDKLNH